MPRPPMGETHVIAEREARQVIVSAGPDLDFDDVIIYLTMYVFML